MKNDSAWPPPVTKNSSRKEMWEEIEALRNEVDAQQREVVEARQAIARNANELTMLRYQVDAVRAVMSLKVGT